MSDTDILRDNFRRIGIQYDNQILDEVSNPEQSEYNIQTEEAFLFAYYQKYDEFEFEVQDLPNNWMQLCSNHEGYTMWETQFIGPLSDRSLVESIIRQTLQGLHDEGKIGEWRIRYNYPPSENSTDSDNEDMEDFMDRHERAMEIFRLG